MVVLVHWPILRVNILLCYLVCALPRQLSVWWCGAVLPGLETAGAAVSVRWRQSVRADWTSPSSLTNTVMDTRQETVRPQSDLQQDRMVWGE